MTAGIFACQQDFLLACSVFERKPVRYIFKVQCSALVQSHEVNSETSLFEN